MEVSILDYGAGNLKSLENSLKHLDYNYKIVTSPHEIEKAEVLIFPGVGNFGQVVSHLEKNDLIPALQNYIRSGQPYLGICIGMQILFISSEESPNKHGLGIWGSSIKKFRQGKVPQIGWNNVSVSDPSSFLMEGYFYFVHSYYIPMNGSKDLYILGKSFYHQDFISAVHYENITGFQFHPEKSGLVGLKTLDRWLKHAC